MQSRWLIVGISTKNGLENYTAEEAEMTKQKMASRLTPGDIIDWHGTPLEITGTPEFWMLSAPACLYAKVPATPTKYGTINAPAGHKFTLIER